MNELGGASSNYKAQLSRCGVALLVGAVGGGGRSVGAVGGRWWQWDQEDTMVRSRRVG